MTRKLPGADEPYKVLAILDEFCALGKMDVLKEGFGFLAGYHVHLMAIIQNVGQFYDLYGGRDKADIFFQNTDYKIAYRQNTKTDKEFVSDLCGMRAVKTSSKSFQHGVIGQRQSGSSESYVAKSLISPDQVGTFPADKGIAKCNGQVPIRYQRIIYYQQQEFRNRILSPISLPKLEIKSQPLKLVKQTKPTQSLQRPTKLSSHDVEQLLNSLSSD